MQSSTTYQKELTKQNMNWSLPEQDDDESEQKKPTPEDEFKTCLKSGNNYIPKITTMGSRYFLNVVTMDGKQLGSPIDLCTWGPVKIVAALPDCKLAYHCKSPDSSKDLIRIETVISFGNGCHSGSAYRTIAYSPNKNYLVAIEISPRGDCGFVHLLDGDGVKFKTNPLVTLTNLYNLAEFIWGQNSVHILDADKVLIVNGPKAFICDLTLTYPQFIGNQRIINPLGPFKYVQHINDFPDGIMAIVQSDKKLYIFKVNGDYENFTKLFQIIDFNPNILPQQFNQFLFYFTKSNFLVKLNIHTLGTYILEEVKSPEQIYITRQGHVIVNEKVLHTVPNRLPSQNITRLDRALASVYSEIPTVISQLIVSYITSRLFFSSLLELKGDERLDSTLRDKADILLYQFMGKYHFEKNYQAGIQCQILLFFSSRLRNYANTINQCVVETEKEYFQKHHPTTIGKKLRNFFNQVKQNPSVVKSSMFKPADESSATKPPLASISHMINENKR